MSEMLSKDQRQKRCKHCVYARVIYANGGFSFVGCHHPPYRGKWVAEIKECPGFLGIDEMSAHGQN